MSQPHRRHYGIAEVAEVLGIDRQLVTVWRRRSSHGMPTPDDELASGPLWVADTIEPWIEQTRMRLAAEAAGRDAAPLTPALIKQTARRILRFVVLLIEEPVRYDIARQSMHELAALRAPLAQAEAGTEGSRRGLRDLLSVADLAGRGADRLGAARADERAAVHDELLAACLQVIPDLTRMLVRLETHGPS